MRGLIRHDQIHGRRPRLEQGILTGDEIRTYLPVWSAMIGQRDGRIPYSGRQRGVKLTTLTLDKRTLNLTSHKEFDRGGGVWRLVMNSNST